MDIQRYLTEPVTYEKYIERDDFDNVQREAPRTILVRVEEKAKWQRSKGELTLVSVTSYLTDEHVGLGDKINDEEIYAFEAIKDFDGSYIGAEAFPRPPIGFTP